MSGTDGKDPYSYIKDMSTEELEALLRAEALSTEDGDSDLTDYILEVIVEREKTEQSGGLLDVNEARREFDALYRGLEKPLYDSSPIAEEVSNANGETAIQSSKPVARRRKFTRILIAAAAVAAIIAVAAIPVFGYPNVITMVAHLANGAFRFVPDTSISGQYGDSSELQPNGTFTTLPEALEAYGIYEQVFPKILAENFEQTELKVDIHDLSNSVVLIAYYENSNLDVKLSFTKYLNPNSWTHEANQEDAQIYSVNGIEHYIFYNVESTTIIWYRGTLECSIKGNLTLDEAEKIIDSIY